MLSQIPHFPARPFQSDSGPVDRSILAAILLSALVSGCLSPPSQCRPGRAASKERTIKNVVVACTPTTSRPCKELAQRIAHTLKQTGRVDAHAAPAAGGQPADVCLIHLREAPNARKTRIAVRSSRLEIHVEAAPLPPFPGRNLPLPIRRNAGLQYAGTILLEDLFRIVEPAPGDAAALSTPLTAPPGNWTCLRKQWPVVIEGATDPAVRAWLRNLGAVVSNSPAVYPWQIKAAPRKFAVLTLPPELGLPILPRPAFVRTCRSLQRLRSPQAVVVRMHPFNLDFLAPSVYTLVRSASERTDDPDLYLVQYSFLYGRAAWNVRQYFRFWENLWNQRGASHWTDLRQSGWGDPVRGVYRQIDKLFSEKDFTDAVRFLHDAQLQVRSPAAKRRLQLLMLAHDHARFIVQAATARNRADGSVTAMKAAIEASRRLEDFRKMFASDLRAPLDRIRIRERNADDATGTAWQNLFRDAEPLQPLAAGWRFRADPDAVGRQQKWFAHLWPVYRGWSPVKVDRPWEAQHLPVRTDSDSTDYDGTAWYAVRLDPVPSWRDRKLYINICVASGNAVTVYVNGKRLAGETSSTGARPSAPSSVLRVRIDPAFRRSTLHEVLVVRIDNQSGPGGFVRPPWLSTARKSPAKAPDSR